MRISKGVCFLLAVIVTAALISGGCLLSRHRQGTSDIRDSPYATPFSLKHGSESLDLLVRVKKPGYLYSFNLVFVEKPTLSEQQRGDLRRLFLGRLVSDERPTPYPVSLRIRIDSMGDKNRFHIDELVSDRYPLHSTFDHEEGAIWRAQRVYANALMPGIYRVRVDNLGPVPEIDFPCLFQFAIDYRK